MADNDTGIKWATDMAQRIGDGVRSRRNHLGISAARLAEQTREIGYPISRSTIAKIESNSRGAKIEVAELAVLAAALDTSPLALMWYDAPDGSALVLPGFPASAGAGYQYWTGEGFNPNDPEYSRTRALRRLLNARRAPGILSALRHPSRGAARANPDENWITAMYEEIQDASAAAANSGWNVEGFNHGP